MFGWTTRGGIQTRRGAVVGASIGAAIAAFGIVMKVLTADFGYFAFAAIGCFAALAAIAERLYSKKIQGDNAGILQLRLTRLGFGIRYGKGEVELRPWRAGTQVEARRWSTGQFVVGIYKPNEKFWTFKMVDQAFVSVEVVFDGELTVTAQILVQIGKWWGMPVASFIESPYYKRRLRVGPLTQAAAGANEDQSAMRAEITGRQK